MKRRWLVIVSVVLVAMLAVSCQGKKGLHMTGEFAEAIQDEADTILLVNVADLLAGNPQVTDTIFLEDGRFDYFFETDSVTVIALFSTDYVRDKKGVMLSFPALPGEEVHLRMSADYLWHMGGSPFYEDWGSVLDWLVREESVDEMVGDSYRYITDNPDKEASAVLLAQVLASYDAELAVIAEAELDEKVRHGRLEALIDRAMDSAEDVLRESEPFLEPDDTAPEFSLLDMDGKEVKLSDFRGKYVVLDFWGSWCKWCIKGFPDMKKYYAKYRNRMEIIGIDCGDSPSEWAAAVREHALPWVQVCMDDAWEVSQYYGVESFPTKYIISPEGKIVKCIIGEDPAFYDLLDELLAE
ncbi:MAG: redoxin domain-containing protein [Paludibacteraceae bacterium]|nr:redoxin domain-containing protein [Paludibacteraceae bacterium]